MTRAIAVILVAVLCAALVGVDVSLSAAQDDAARQQAISTRVSKIDVGSVVKIERTDGRKIEGVLTAKTTDSITVDIYQRRAFRSPRLVRTDTISLDDVKDIKKPLSRAQVALITTGVVVGSCAALGLIVSSSLSSKSPHTDTSTGDEPSADAFEAAEPPMNDQGTPITVR
jgi:hypothetical protein